MYHNYRYQLLHTFRHRYLTLFLRKMEAKELCLSELMNNLSMSYLVMQKFEIM